MHLTKPQRAKLRTKFDSRCAYCGCKLADKGWHADHVEPVLREWWKSTNWYRETHGFKYEIEGDRVVKTEVPIDTRVQFMRPQNDVLDNLFPACRACNLDKAALSLEQWRTVLQDKVGVLRRNYKAFGHAERFGLLREIKKSVVFWFEIYEEKQNEKFNPVA